MRLNPELRRAVRATPDDDTLRLVAADWLAEQGDVDRAAFVRAQVERASLPDPDPRRVDLELVEWALRARAEAAWRAELPDLGPAVRFGRFDRGFVRTVAFSDPDDWLDRGSAVFDATLVDRLVVPWARNRSLDPLPVQPGLRRLSLIGAIVDHDDVRWLADSPILSTIEELDLLRSDIAAPDLRILLGSPHLRPLRALRMPQHQLGDAGVEVLVDSAQTSLVELDLRALTYDELGSGGRYEPTITAPGASRLAAWPGLASVEVLDLTGQQLDVDGFRALLGSAHTGALRRLHMRGCSDYRWEDEGSRADVLSAFEAAHPALSLEHLEIGECELSDRVSAILADSPALASLRAFRMELVQGRPSAFTTLAGAPWIAGLRRLAVVDHPSDTFLAEALAAPRPELHSLEVESSFHWSRHTDLVGLLQRGHPLALRRLALREAFMQDDDLDRLGISETLPALQAAVLGGDSWYARAEGGISEDAARRFLSSPLGAGLASVSVVIASDTPGPSPRRVERLPPPVEPTLPMGRWPAIVL